MKEKHMPAEQSARLIVGMSGSSAPHLGAAFLAALRQRGDVESHFVLSAGARRSIELEMRTDPAEVERLADVVYDASDPDAAIGSGSFPAAGMVIIPCSMRTLAAVASGDSDNLVSRAAALTLAGRRRLVLVTRETPLSYIHLRNMAAVTEAGATVLPPIPEFPVDSPPITSLLSRLCAMVLDQFSF
jgi:polyprenyl P-hydroxybenzoate/phenylacrylic acid decarboxylase-like protein